MPTVDSRRFAPSGREWRPSGGAASPSQYGATRFRPAPRRFEIESQAPLSLSLERCEHLYRIVQEAVTNALRHAHAAHIGVRVIVTAETVQVDVEDDGVGMQGAPSSTNGFGMRSIGLRAAAVGATIAVLAKPDGGTRIHAECPQQEQVGGCQPAQLAAKRTRITSLAGHTLERNPRSAANHHRYPPTSGGAAARRRVLRGPCRHRSSRRNHRSSTRRDQLAVGSTLASGRTERGGPDSGRRPPLAGNFPGNAGGHGRIAESTVALWHLLWRGRDGGGDDHPLVVVALAIQPRLRPAGRTRCCCLVLRSSAPA